MPSSGKLIAERRRYTRSNARAPNEQIRSEAREKYVRKKEILKKMIDTAKKKCWKALLKEIDNDTYGLGFKIAVNKLRPRKPVSMDETELRNIVSQLFPSKPIQEDEELAHSEAPPVTDDEIIAAAG